MLPKLGVLAGGGQLPVQVVAACRARQRPFFIVAFVGFTDPATVDGTPHAWLPVERVGAILARLHAEGVSEVVLAGPVRRPGSVLTLRPDWRGVKLLLRMLRRWRGDDHVLTQVVREIESDGFRVVGAEDIAPELLMPSGPLGSFTPDERHRGAIAMGVAAARELGRLDRGQAVLVADGQVVAREETGGTTRMLANAVAAQKARGGVLVKIAKPGQERRVDLPSVGTETVRQSAKAGLAGIALEAGGSLVIDREGVVRAADEAGLFVVGVETRP
ncbi:MAG: LpxI family protein [Alphaproteobacteria bacterium]|nr:LpxI family protein [Alphaproteobacteria bacterium]